MVGIIHLSSMKNYMWMKRKKNVKRKKNYKWKKEKDENERWEWNEMKRKEGRKGVMWWEKERIGGWSRSEKFVHH